MYTITNRFLVDAGLGELPHETLERYRTAFVERVHQRVVARLWPEMTDGQRHALAAMRHQGGRLEVVWLQINFPEVRRIAIEETEHVRRSVAPDAAELLSLELAFAATPTDTADPGVSHLNDQEQ